MFFGWIMGLATLAAVVYPFSSSAPLSQKIATAVVNLVIGVAIWSLLSMIAARAVRRAGPPKRRGQPDWPVQPSQDAGYVPGQRNIGPNDPTQPLGWPQDPGRGQWR
jgi:hypothetical protein